MHEQTRSHDLHTQTHNGVIWVDSENPSPEVLAGLERNYKLHPVHLKESTQKVQHDQVEREANYLFFVLHMPVMNRQLGKITVNQVGIFLGKDFLITIRTGHNVPIVDLYAECQGQPIQAERYFEQGPAYLLYVVVSRLLSDISHMTESIESELDSIEDSVFDNNGSDAQLIGKVRQKIVKLRRVIGPKKLLLQDLTEQIGTFSSKNMMKYYQNNTKTVNKLWEVIEEAKETVEIYKDADFTTSTEQTNKILAILTIIFTLSIPVTVLASLYGMNVLLPGSVNGTPWTFFGRYTTFGIVITVSCLFGFGMFAYFKRKKWF